MDRIAMDVAVGRTPTAKEKTLFEELARQHYAGIYNYLCYVSRDQILAEDLTQETFMQVWQHLAELKSREAARVWLYRIARNQFLQYRRRAGLDTVSFGICEDLLDSPISDSNPQLALERIAVQEALIHALSELPEAYREVIVLHNLEQLSLAQVAAVLEVPVGTIKSRRARAFTALRQLLQQEAVGDEV